MIPVAADVKGPRRRRAEATRQKILRAAHEEFVERGYHGATIASIARRAGVATQTVYFVFHTKTELVSAAIDALPPVQRAVITLRDVVGMEPGEVCGLMGLTDGNQRVLLHRARSRVRRALDAHLSVEAAV